MLFPRRILRLKVRFGSGQQFVTFILQRDLGKKLPALVEMVFSSCNIEMREFITAISASFT